MTVESRVATTVFLLWLEMKRDEIASGCITFIPCFVISLCRFEIMLVTLMFMVYVASGCFLDNGS